jgi:hypothetical protein
MRKHFLSSVLVFVLLFSFNYCSSQQWNFDKENNAYFLDNLFYQNLKCIKRDFDSNYLVITSHKVDYYWGKGNAKKSKLIVSKIDTLLKISIIKNTGRSD